MITASLETFLESLLGSDKLAIRLDYNDHKGAYQTVDEIVKEDNSTSDKWISKDDCAIAITTNTMYEIFIDNERFNDCVRKAASGILPLLTFFGGDKISPVLISEIIEFETFLKTLLKGKYTSAHVELTTGVMVSHSKDQWEKYPIDKMIDFNADHFADSWVGSDEKEKAIANNKLWSIQWYPDTTIGSYMLYGASLEVIVNFIIADIAEDGKKDTF